MSLTSPAVHALGLESSVLDLFREWLALWFDGASHTVGGHATIAFPKAELLFQVAKPPQPMTAGAQATPLAIHVVWMAPSKPSRCFEPMPGTGVRQEWVTQQVTLHFWVHCGAVDAGQGSADYLAGRTADLLHGILNNSAATRVLAAKGLHSLSASSHVLPFKGNSTKEDFATRLLSATARVRYAILSQS